MTRPILFPFLFLISLPLTVSAENVRVEYVRGGEPIVQVQPIYPQRAEERGVVGSVRYQFDITQQGAVTNIKLLTKTVDARFFSRAGQVALKRTRYQSRSFSGAEVIYHFELPEGLQESTEKKRARQFVHEHSSQPEKVRQYLIGQWEGTKYEGIEGADTIRLSFSNGPAQIKYLSTEGTEVNEIDESWHIFLFHSGEFAIELTIRPRELSVTEFNSDREFKLFYKNRFYDVRKVSDAPAITSIDNTEELAARDKAIAEEQAAAEARERERQAEAREKARQSEALEIALAGCESITDGVKQAECRLRACGGSPLVCQGQMRWDYDKAITSAKLQSKSAELQATLDARYLDKPKRINEVINSALPGYCASRLTSLFKSDSSSKSYQRAEKACKETTEDQFTRCMEQPSPDFRSQLNACEKAVRDAGPATVTLIDLQILRPHCADEVQPAPEPFDQMAELNACIEKPRDQLQACMADVNARQQEHQLASLQSPDPTEIREATERCMERMQDAKYACLQQHPAPEQHSQDHLDSIGRCIDAS